MPRGKVRLPTDEELRWITGRAVAEIIPQAEFVEALRSGRRLRLKMGFDPTRPVVTLGWAVGLRKLRQLQELGHQAVVIIGDWTAQIGDPSGESQTRPMLGADEVKASAEAVLRQFYRVLDEERTEVRWQGEWFGDPTGARPGGFSLADVIRLAARFTVAQMLERDDFAQRYGAHKPIGIHELIYPLLQAYDSIAVEADVEFGGSDQKFNILVGRELQSMLGQRPQSAFLMPLLVGLDGVQKMSQSLGNYIGVEQAPHDMYGKIMSLPDAAMPDYFELLTDLPEEELAEVRRSLEERDVNPMEAKMRLAREIVGQFHSPEAAREAEEEFVRVFRKREAPEKVVEFSMSLEKDFVAVKSTSTMRGIEGKPEEVAQTTLHSLPHVIHSARLARSVSEAFRLIEQGGVDRMIEDRPETVREPRITLRDGDILRVGKHRFLRIVDADKH